MAKRAGDLHCAGAMVQVPPLTLEGLIELETRHSATGQLPVPLSFAHRFYTTLIGQGDAKRAEAEVLLERQTTPDKAHRLLQGRALLARGQVELAAAQYGSLREGDPSHPAPEGEGGGGLGAEIRMEEARIACYEGDWEKARSLSEQAIALEPAPISWLSLYQIHSLACFEVADFAEAARDIARVESLSSVFPVSPPVLYARILSARLRARDRDPEIGLSLLRPLWSEVLAPEPRWPVREALVALLLAQSDLERLCGKPRVSTGLAMRALAAANGDELYAALGLLDAYASADEPLRQKLEPELGEASDRFGRIRRARAGTGITAVTLAPYLSRCTPRAGTGQAELSLRPCAIYLPEDDALVTLEPWGIERLASSPRLSRALAVLASGPLSRERFFQCVWGQSRYRPELHDEPVRGVIRRIRDLGVPVDALRGGVRAQDLLAVNRS